MNGIYWFFPVLVHSVFLVPDTVEGIIFYYLEIGKRFRLGEKSGSQVTNSSSGTGELLPETFR